MEEEVELREYLEVIARRWRIIAIVFLATVTAGAILTFVQVPVYEATTALIEPAYQLGSASGVTLTSLDEDVGRPVRLYSALTKSDTLERRVVEILEPILSPGEREPGALRSMVRVVEAEEKENPALFYIKAQSTDPEKARRVANAWAQAYMEFTAELSGESSPELAGIGEQLEAAEGELAAVEDAMARFQQETGIGIASSDLDPYAFLGERGEELRAKILILVEHRVARDNLLLLLQMAGQIKAAGGDASDLPLELLAVNAIADRGQLSPQILQEQADDLDSVVALLEAEEEVMSTVVRSLSTEVTQLKEGLTNDKWRLDDLRRARDLSEERLTALRRKALEIEIRGGGVTVVSYATTPEKARGPNWRLNLMAAVVVGLFGGVFAALAWEYLQGSPEWKKRGG